MKYSKYNVFSEKSKLMYNTLNQSMVQLSPEVFNGFKKEDPELFTKLTDFKSYMENGFLIDDSCSEIQILKDRYWRNKYNDTTLSFCEKILVFDQGEIIQEGNHEELLRQQKGKYRELWDAQAEYYNL